MWLAEILNLIMVREDEEFFSRKTPTMPAQIEFA